MLQRIQSIFLLLVSILSLQLFFVTLETVTINNDSFPLTLNPTKVLAPIGKLIYLPITINGCILFLSLITLFLYKRRLLQMKFCVIIALACIALMASLLSFTFFKVEDGNTYTIQYSYTLFLPALNILLAHIAKKFIKNDEELVKSADRIR